MVATIMFPAVFSRRAAGEACMIEGLTVSPSLLLSVPTSTFAFPITIYRGGALHVTLHVSQDTD